MALFPISLPARTSGRGSTHNNLARLVGPLFGVAVEDAPHRRSWVCDYDRLKIREIGRGAPDASREVMLGDRGLRDDQLLEKGVVPSALNKFDPDAKAAAVLASANVLFAPLTADLASALNAIIGANRPENEDGADSALRLAPIVLISFWAVGMLSIYRSYPLLVASALKARAVQRILSANWNIETPAGLATALPEYGSSAWAEPLPGSPRDRPVRLECLDHSLAVLNEYLPSPTSSDVEQPADSLAAVMARVILRIGGSGEGEPAVIWAAEPDTDQRSVEVYFSPLRAIKNFLSEQGVTTLPRSDSEAMSIDVVPELPTPQQWNALEPTAKRLLIEMYSVVYRWLREQDVYGEESEVGEACLTRLGHLEVMAVRDFGQDDPVALDCIVALLTGKIRKSLREDVPVDIDPALGVLDRLRHLIQERRIDSGFALDLLARASVVVNRARNSDNSGIDGVMLVEPLKRYWESYEQILLSYVGVRPGASAGGYHLHNYAGFLGTIADEQRSLARAVDLFRRYVIPSRQVAAAVTPRANSLRLSLQVGARSTVLLARSLRAEGLDRAARQEITDGVDWVTRAMHTVNAEELLARSSPVDATYLFALIVCDVFILAHDLDVPIDIRQIALARRWLDKAAAWVEGPPRGDGSTHGQRLAVTAAEFAARFGAA
jgi:hypothetical protein